MLTTATTTPEGVVLGVQPIPRSCQMSRLLFCPHRNKYSSILKLHNHSGLTEPYHHVPLYPVLSLLPLHSRSPPLQSPGRPGYGSCSFPAGLTLSAQNVRSLHRVADSHCTAQSASVTQPKNQADVPLVLSHHPSCDAAGQLNKKPLDTEHCLQPSTA